MDATTPDQDKCASWGSWIPATHFRPILPKPLPNYVNGQANQLEQANLLGSECSSSTCSQVPQAYRGFEFVNNAYSADMNKCVNNWEATSAGKMGITCDNSDKRRGFAMEAMARWKDVPFGELLALADAATSGTMPPQNGLATGSFIFTSHSQIDNGPHLSIENEESSFESNHWTSNDIAQDKHQYELSNSHRHSYDLNFPPVTVPAAVSHKTFSEFAPITPDKAIRDKCNQVSELQNPCRDDSINQERDVQNFIIGDGRDDSSGIQCNKEVSKPVTDATVGTVSVPLEDNNNPDNGSSHGLIDMNKTPLQKPRRKKHRPKVIREGKARTRKPVIPKPDGSTENPTGKRKYVRRKVLDKDSTSSPLETVVESTDQRTLEPTKESCRKSINFDLDGQPRDENTTCKSTVDLISESQANVLDKSKSTVQLSKGFEVMTPNPAGSKENPRVKRKYVRRKVLNKDSTPSPTQAAGASNDQKELEPTNKSCRRTLNFDIEGRPVADNSTCQSTVDLDSETQTNDIQTTGIQSKSTVQISEGLEVIIENTPTGIAYDLTRSVNQVLNDYISLPEGQAPTTPLPAKTNLRGHKQKDGPRKENDTERKDQGTAHNGQGHTTPIMFQIDTRSSVKSLNDCKRSRRRTRTVFMESGQAPELKRKFVEQADTSGTNLIGIHYHTLQAYQMPWAHFPNICKRRRTEKGQNSTTSSTSSVTTTTDVAMGTTCPQSDSKAERPPSNANSWISAPQPNASGIPTTLGEARTFHQHKQQTLEDILALSTTERLTKRRLRSKGPTRVRDLASLTRIAECRMQSTYPGSHGSLNFDKQQIGNSDRPNTCLDALVAEMHETLTKKKRTKKRNSLVNSASPGTDEVTKDQKIFLYNQHQFSANSSGILTEPMWKQISLDEITERLKHLDINRESSHVEYQQQNELVLYNMRNQEHNALVLYRRDGTVVPFQGSFNFVKKRQPRPKVELDEETNRVWKLLLENINSEGIDGTNEKNAKWWEEERKVFHGRVDSFIARMHLVQGDRRFSPWKGSVVDSVVGVFLTQNVSDHLSSSAYMALAARFPLKSNNQKSCYEDGTSSVIEQPEVVIEQPEVMDPVDAIEWNEKMSSRRACDQSSMTFHDSEPKEEKEVVSSNDSLESSSSIVNSTNESNCKLLNSCDSDLETYCDSAVNRSTKDITATGTTSFIGETTTTNGVISSQHSAVSSQISMDSSIAQSTKRTGASSNSNSEARTLTNGSKLNGFNGSPSFLELLQMAGSTMMHGVYNHGNHSMSSVGNSNEHNQFQAMQYDNLRVEDLDGPKDSLGASSTPPSSLHPHLTQNSAVETECFEIFKGARFSGISRNSYKNSMTGQTAATPELTSQTIDATKQTESFKEAPRPSSKNKQSGDSMHNDENITAQRQRGPLGDCRFVVGSLAKVQNNKMQEHPILPDFPREALDVTESSSAFDKSKTSGLDLNKHDSSLRKELSEINGAASKSTGRRKKDDFDWDSLRRQVEANGKKKERSSNTMDSLDWEAVRCADVNKIAHTIRERGMNNMLAERIKDFLNRVVREHGSIDLEWLRDVPPDKAKEYLLSIRGLGLKSVECIRLLTLHHLAFPVDTNVGRIAVRLGWVPLQPLPESLQLHLLELYPVLESIQKYLWPRLCKLDQRTLYELHYQMITFGKVFCTKSKPNCNACPMRGECRHFASAFASSRLALPGPEEKAIVSAEENRMPDQNPTMINSQLPLLLPQATQQSEAISGVNNCETIIGNLQPEAITGVNNCEPMIGNQQSEAISRVNNCQPIIEEPASPEPECIQISEKDMEDAFWEDPDEIPTIKLNVEEFTQTLQNYMQKNMELQEGDMSKALVALTAEAASIPTPKLKNMSRLRTEHQVYELPDSHPLLEGLDKREPDDPGRYLLAIWTPGETPSSIQPPETTCSSQEHGKLCNEKTCFSCNSVREAESHIVRGTLLIPCRTAMRGSFPLNGTYFQVNEVFADHDSSLCPMNVPSEWIWNLPRRTVYFGTSVPTIFKGLTTEGIQHCFWRGYVCVRGFDQKTRAPRPLMARLHFPASKLKAQGKAEAEHM